MLIDAGVEPIVRVSGVDEEAMTAALGPIAPADLALVLARAKAREVSERADELTLDADSDFSDSADMSDTDMADTDMADMDTADTDMSDTVIVGCDSVFELDGVAYGKPLTEAVAIERITAMSGRTGQLHTGHWVIRAGLEAGRTATTQVEFARMQADEITAYVATGEPLQVAGAFTLDGLAAPYVRRIVGDPSNVLGISLPTMRELLAEVGVPWQRLWTAAGR